MNSASNNQTELNEVKERDKAEYKKTLDYYINQLKNPAEDPSPGETLGALCNVKAKLDALEMQGGKRKSRRNKKNQKSKRKRKIKKSKRSKTRRKSGRR